MRQFKLLFFFLAVFLVAGATQVFAYTQYESMEVGETKTFYFPSEVTSKQSMIYAYNCYSNRISNIEVVSYTKTSVTVKALAYTQYTVYISFDYWWYENNYGRHNTHLVSIDLKKPKDDNGGGSNTDPDDDETLTLSANPAGGNVDKGTTVYLTSNPSGANIYYTLDGSSPTSNSTKYTSSGITIDESCTLKAVAMKSGYNNSAVMTWNYSVTDPVKAQINATNFPDANFRNYLLGQWYGKDGVLTESEVKGITYIDVRNENISNLRGIENFTALETLYCSSNQLTALDVSKNTALTELFCSSNQLTALDVSKNTALTELRCYNNQLTALDVSGCTALTSLWCSDNQLTALDVSKNTALTELFCERNPLTALDVSKNTALTKLWCYNNQLTALDVSGCTALTSLSCEDNPLTALDVSGCTALTSLTCRDNQLTALDVSKNTALTSLYCYNNQLTALDVSKNTALTSLWCNNNQLTALDVSKNTALKYLYCYNNQLTALDVSKNTALTELSCYVNQLTALDVSKNTALTSLHCWYNQLMALDVSKNTELTTLYCSSNQLTALDVSKNTALTTLNCGYNQLTALDVSKNTALTELSCYGNQLTALDVSKNTALTSLDCDYNQLTALDVSKNTALTKLDCCRNQIKGVSMDALISSLPKNQANEIHSFRVINSTNSIYEGNVCTKSQAVAVRAKGWTPQYYNGTEWAEYEGSDDEPGNDITIDETHFPDVNFRNYLLSQSYGKDGILTEEEIETITTMNVRYQNINSLQGIEYFTGLTTLYCHNNKLTSLDVSKNTLLRRLDCFGNRIQGVAMDNLISSLPMNTTNDSHIFSVWEMSYNGNEDEDVCTKAQVEAAKAKGWTSYYVDGYTALLGHYYGCDADPIGIKLPEMEAVNVSSTIQLTATVEPAYITPELAWSSSAENIAMVTSTGKVLGVSAGAAIITVRTSNGLSAECFVIVQDVSGIEDVNAGDSNNKTVYTISGQKVTKPAKGGIYIVNGKKVVVK